MSPPPAPPPLPAPSPAPPADVPPAAVSETGPDHGPRRKRRWIPIAAGAAAVAVAAIAAVVVFAGGGDGGTGGAAGAADTQQTTGQITPCPPAGQPAVCITAVERNGNALQVAFTTHDVTLVSDPSAEELTATFFLGSIDSTASTGVALRQWGASSPFEQQYSAEELDGASAVCVLVGNGAGQIAPGTGNCAELPKA